MRHDKDFPRSRRRLDLRNAHWRGGVGGLELAEKEGAVMTVGDLKDLLQNVDRRLLVILASDAEGNSYSPLDEATAGNYADGEVGLEKLTEEDKKNGYGEEDVLNGAPAIVLYPV